MYVCRNCGYRSIKWLGRCPSCGQWDTFILESEESTSRSPERVPRPRRMMDVAVEAGSSPRRLKSGIDEWDRVLGGGIVPTSMVILGGDPGIGKSTMALQVSAGIHAPVLYVSAEEAPAQVARRARRLDLRVDDIHILAEHSADAIANLLRREYYSLVVVDSIQMMKVEGNPSYPGSVSQVRDATLLFQEVARSRNIAFLIIGHVTKSGEIAGPRAMEHMVDVVLYLEGDRKTDLRILRAYKNRYGSTDEIGLFVMKETGLQPIEDPHRLFVSPERGPRVGVARSVVMEGRRTIPVEVQALAVRTYYASPMRNTTGYDVRRLNMLLAVLEKHARIRLRNYDIFVNIVGGLKVSDWAVDSAVLMAIVSAFRGFPLDPEAVFIGEVGLTGDVLPVPSMDLRLKEAERIGVRTAYANAEKSDFEKGGIKILKITNIGELLSVCLE